MSHVFKEQGIPVEERKRLAANWFKAAIGDLERAVAMLSGVQPAEVDATAILASAKILEDKLRAK